MSGSLSTLSAGDKTLSGLEYEVSIQKMLRLSSATVNKDQIKNNSSTRKMM